MSDIRIRPAEITDADRISAVLIASITHLCVADHRNDPAIITAWTANKTPDSIRRWFSNDRMQLFVAQVTEEVAGVGACDADGRVVLNYVHPDYRAQGVSRGMLRHLEDHLAAGGVTLATLTATQTALQFYRSAG